MESTPNENVSTTPPVAPAPAPDKNVVMGVLAYLGPLVIVSYLAAKDDEFVKFHIKQGVVLFVASIAVWFLGSLMVGLWMLLQVVNLGILILSIIGIVNVVQKQQKPLPLVGQFSHLVPL